MQNPTATQIARITERLGLHLERQEQDTYRAVIGNLLDSYRTVWRMDDELPATRYPRTAGSAPGPADNPFNGWQRRTKIVGSPTGRLSGKSIALKDNILLAGVPMANGCASLEGYVPEVDATIVTRVLDEGAAILGKASCETLCVSGGSHTNAWGPVRNPYRPDHTAGGSSSGCAVLVSTGEVDMAIGGDQGGSIRMPAACCGVYGMKPTYGLVPYSGVMPIEVLVDHVGPMTANVLDNALLLEVLAGADGLDPRQPPTITQVPYASTAREGVAGLRIGLLREGFDSPNADPAVAQKVIVAADRLAKLGATITDISVPMHRRGPDLWMPVGVWGFMQTLMLGDGLGAGREDLYVPSLMQYHRHWRQRADELSVTCKILLMLGTFVSDEVGTFLAGKAINLTRRLRNAYDAAFGKVDLLLMPTCTTTAPPLPPTDAPADLLFTHAIQLATNTMPFNLSHHPAMSVPCGMLAGLPVGMMLVGRSFDEASIYRAAYSFEQHEDWKTL